MMRYEAEMIAGLIKAMSSEQAQRLAVGMAAVAGFSLSDLLPSDHLWRRTLALRLERKEHLLLADVFLHYLSFVVRQAGAMEQRLAQASVDCLPLLPDTSTMNRWGVRIWPSLLLENPNVLLACGAYLMSLREKEISDSREPVRVHAFVVDRLAAMLWRHRKVLARQTTSIELMRSDRAQAFLRRLVVDYGAPSPMYDPTGVVPVLRIETRAGEVVQPFDEATARNVLNMMLRRDCDLVERLQRLVFDYLNRPLPPAPSPDELRAFAADLAALVARAGGRPLVSRSFAAMLPISLLRRRNPDEEKRLMQEILFQLERLRHELSPAMLKRQMQWARRLLGVEAPLREPS